jgi:hypothetical protein
MQKTLRSFGSAFFPPAEVLFLRLTELQSKGKSAWARWSYFKPMEKP